MANRLTKIYTRTGDRGDTSLGDGTRISKDNIRVETFGTIDELNSLIGVVLSQIGMPEDIQKALLQIQHQLFDLGGELCMPDHKMLTPAETTALEEELDRLNAYLPPLKEFVLPGGCPASSFCHLARTVCRRAERLMIQLNKITALNPDSIAYINRLSDLLFVMARYINLVNKHPETLWNNPSKKA